MKIALANYNDERQYGKDLPEVCDVPDLTGFAENGLGVAAFEKEQTIGFLCCSAPFDNVFRATDVRGFFSPMGANGAIGENCSKIYASMYQAAGEKWVKAGAVSHAIYLYAHDEELHTQFFRYGFGLRCLDAVRPMEQIDCGPCAGYEFAELEECHLLSSSSGIVPPLL